MLTPVLFLLSWFLAPALADFIAKIGTPAGKEFLWQFQLLTLIKQVILLPALASIAVAWHRLVLMNEQPQGTYLKIDRAVWLYVAYLFATQLLFNGVGQLPSYLAAATGTTAPDWAVGLSGLLVVPLVFVVARYSPILVAIALGRSDIGLGDVWRATRRNTSYLYYASSLVGIVRPRRKVASE